MRTGFFVLLAFTCGAAITFTSDSCVAAPSTTAGNKCHSGATTPAQDDWILSLMDEPVLTPIGKPPGYFALRILYVPTFRNPIAVRYESCGNSTVYRAVRLSGRGGYEMGAIKSQEQSHPAKAQISALKQALQNSGYWSLSPRDSVRGLDGSELVVETVSDGKHRIIGRWSPESNAQARKLDGLVAFFTSEFKKAGFWPLAMPSNEELKRLVPRPPPPPPPPPPGYQPHTSGLTSQSSGRKPATRVRAADFGR
jgi:hypothetical protein